MIIAICGFMGAGKSTFLTQFPEVDSFDLDGVIEDKVGVLGDYIRTEGWESFRSLESKTLNDLLIDDGDRLISLGGGALDRQENIDLLKSAKAKILFLELSFEECMVRIKGDNNRPQLDKSDKELEELFKKRELIYKDASDFILSGDGELWPTSWNLLKTLL